MAHGGQALYASEGVVVRRPAARATRAPDPHETYLCYPTGASAEQAMDADDAETLAVFQELALRYAMEQTRSTVRTVLLRANKKCYSDVHSFFQRHMQRVALQRDRSAAVPRVVAFPSLMKMPAVAIVSGSDATFSDVWMTPLCQVIHRSFPVILVIRDGVENVRRMVEWVLERLDDYAGMKKREEAWLGQQIDAWYAFVEQRKAGKRPMAAPVPAAQQSRRLRAQSRRTAPKLEQLGGKEESDDDYIFFDAGESTSSSDDDGEGPAVRKKSGAKRKRHGKVGGPKRRVKYGDLLLDALLLKLRSRMEIIERASDQTLTWTATLREVIQEDLRKQLELCEGSLESSIKSYCDTFEWIKTRILAYRQLRRLPTSIRASTAEYSLATLAYRVLTEFLAFINGCSPVSTTEVELVVKWRREIQIQLERLEDTNHLHQFDVRQYEEVAEQLDPYLLICIEHLDQFNLQVLRDFVDLWSHFADRHPETGHYTRIGLIFGITTTTSQTLRQLGLSVMRRLDIQFFPLEDSKTRSDDILEALFVHNNFPLSLCGDALRLLNDRHLTSQSLTAFTQVLELMALSHFQDSPWSFLSRFAFNVHRRKPLFTELPKGSALRRWVIRKNFRGRSLREVLSCFSDSCVETLLAKFGSSAQPEDRFSPLERELERFGEMQARWVVGWKCFRLTCTWFKVEERNEKYVDCLATALDGQATRLKQIDWCTTKIETESIQKLKYIMEDWYAAASSLRNSGLKIEIQDLIMLATHILDTPADPDTVRMRPFFRKEISSFFRGRIVPLMDVEKPKPGTGRALVRDWVLAVKDPSAIRENVTVKLHEDVTESLTHLDDESYANCSAVGDLSLAFLHYREHATLQLNVADWFSAFAEAVREETEDEEGAGANEAELNARFARALATLRLWGYIKGPDGVRGSGRRHLDAKVDKRIFM